MTSYLYHFFRILIYDKFATDNADINGKYWDLISGKFP